MIFSLNEILNIDNKDFYYDEDRSILRLVSQDYNLIEYLSKKYNGKIKNNRNWHEFILTGEKARCFVNQYGRIN